ncbi:hypothetical protein [Micromonospora sonneratiae]|uniref:Uncharacterized protein n=1 Tax=Micromonospora sonneratiae TaxID=1184706 RepID=A0ABW3YKQ2_9ACTN
MTERGDTLVDKLQAGTETFVSVPDALDAIARNRRLWSRSGWRSVG